MVNELIKGDKPGHSFRGNQWTKGPQTKGLITPTSRNAKQRQAMEGYMSGFTNYLKDPKEKSYCEARSKQMVNGVKRPSGMSAQYGIPKARIGALEGVLYKVFRAGREKIGV